MHMHDFTITVITFKLKLKKTQQTVQLLFPQFTSTIQ